MKKILTISAITAMLLASCANEEPVKVTVPGNTIGFNTHVGKVTKAEDVTTANLQSFYVYGGYEGTTVFNAQEVISTDGGWAYTPLKYWEEGKEYSFAAVAPNVPASYDLTTLKIEGYEASDEDLIVATTGSYTAKEEGNDNISLNFKHALSKVKFTFTNLPADAEVTGIKLKGVNSSANLQATYGTGTTIEWQNPTSPKTYSLNEEEAIYVIPQIVSSDMVLSFTMSEKTWDVNLNTAALTAWDMGQAYNYTVNLANGEAIGFGDITIDAWEDGSGSLQNPEENDGYEEGQIVVNSVIAGNLRSNNATVANWWNGAEIEINSKADGTKFPGLMKFEWTGIPDDAELISATLRIVSTQTKGAPVVTLWTLNTSIQGSETYENLESELTDLFSSVPDLTFKLAGQNTKALNADPNNDKGDEISEDYRNVSAWTNLEDVTKLINLSSNEFNFVLLRGGEHNDSYKLATQNIGDKYGRFKTEGDTYEYFTCSANDLKPQLTIKYRYLKED